jgi:hypothetical protein
LSSWCCSPTIGAASSMRQSPRSTDFGMDGPADVCLLAERIRLRRVASAVARSVSVGRGAAYLLHDRDLRSPPSGPPRRRWIEEVVKAPHAPCRIPSWSGCGIGASRVLRSRHRGERSGRASVDGALLLGPQTSPDSLGAGHGRADSPSGHAARAFRRKRCEDHQEMSAARTFSRIWVRSLRPRRW